ncbi:MAG: alanine--tRNA ligase [Algisphaera sp.]
MPTQSSTPTPSAAHVRQQFIDFFVQKAGHTAVASAPVVPHDDPTLLFTNAGMNQFKDVFLGTGSRAYTRAVDTQKCIRAGGKHNDLDDVGHDTYHHTFFEMLGNWSFGDYFKKEAVTWAWELLTSKEWWGIDPTRLHATYFEGDASEGLEPDHEARDLWLQFLPPEQVHPGNKKDNFWEMGDTGPCGPCSELHYDRSPDKSGASLVNADDQDTVVEIWNLVFIQYNRLQSGQLDPLPHKHVDTGMGFERIVRVLQGVNSNYDTDVFGPLFDAIQKATQARAYTPGGDAAALADPINVAYRVIADHIRTLTFALADGAHCGSDGRSYVLRRILRRAVRYGRQTLGVSEPFFYQLVPAVVANFGDTFPGIVKAAEAVAAEIQEEEVAFGNTLDRGIALFDAAAKGLPAGGQISGKDAFLLHDTYGFPLDLTQLMADERGLVVDADDFDRRMAEAKEKSKAGAAGGDAARQSLLEIVQRGELPATEFTGYVTTEAAQVSTPVFAFRVGSGCGLYKPAEKTVPAGKPCAVVLGQTPFYAEAGGQVGDTGVIQMSDGARIKVTEMIKIGEVIFHLGQVVAGELATADSATVALAVDAQRRGLIQNNHTTTHLMNRALRDHVNVEANQKGSLVNDQRLRFDFTHGSALTPEQINAVEKQVNADIAANHTVYTQVVPQEKALTINGLRAVFGEKYPPHVRVVSIGASVDDLVAQPDDERWPGFSIEFCGGTHLAQTGDAQTFTVVGQEAVSRGVRRVIALTGPAAAEANHVGKTLLEKAQALQSATPEDLALGVESITVALAEKALPLTTAQSVRAVLADLGKALKEHQKAQGNQAQAVVVQAAQAVADAADTSGLIITEIPGADAKSLRTAMDVIRKKHPEAAMLLAAIDGPKVALLASVPKSLIAKGLKAGDWIKHVAPIVDGGGGGKPDQAQAGGKNPAKLPEALDVARTFATQQLG